MKLPARYQNKILSNDEGIAKHAGGFKKADLHVHSSCSIDVLPAPEFHPEALYQQAMQLGMDYFTITDHDTVEAYDIIGWQREKLVTGVEVSIFDSVRVGHTIHINVYEFDKQQFTEMDSIASKDRNIETLTAFLKDQDLPYTYNHPFWFAQQDTPNYDAVLDLVELFPVIEYNFKRIKKKNLMALWLAAQNDKGIICNTDTHIGQIGEVYTLSRGETFKDWFRNLMDGESFIVPKDMETENLTEEMYTWIKTIFEIDETSGKTFAYTKNNLIDNVINYVARKSAKDHPRVFPMLQSLLCSIANTGLLPYLYVRSQNRIANRIGRQLQIPEIA